MTRGGRKKASDEPERRCIVTGERGGKAGLVRFVVGPDDAVVPDILERLPGRGMWVSAERDAIEKAAQKRLFSRAAKRQVAVPDELAESVESLLARRVIELVSLARKAGEAVTGAEKVKEWLTGGTAAVLLQASDGSPRERARLRPPEGDDTHFVVLTADELGLAFGRERVIHAALSPGGLAGQVRSDSARLRGVRGRTALL